MPSQYAIAIGGTGAKCVEALVHLCAAGLGPKQLTIMYVDPDRSNGNVSRSIGAVTRYQALREALKDTAVESSLFKTDIRLLQQWTIFEKKGMKLEEFIGYSKLTPNQMAMVGLLFSEAERQIPLDEGFRGHPSIGAAVMASCEDKNEPWKSFWQSVMEESSPRGMKVFLFGSIFGGTGAAGFPTLASLIMRDTRGKLEGGKNKIVLGGALMLPYFAFKTPTDNQRQKAGLFVESDDFPIAAKAALKYYSSKDLEIQDYYLLGDVPDKTVGEFNHGNEGQKNDVHYIELLAGLGALDFFNEGGKDDVKHYFLAARRQDKTVSWDDLPVSRLSGDSARRFTVRAQLGTLAAFCYSFSNIVWGEIESHAKQHQTFYVENFAKLTINPLEAHSADRLGKIDQYCKDFLSWAIQMSNESYGTKSVRLFQTDKLRKPWRDDPRSLSNLISGIVSSVENANMLKRLNHETISAKITDPVGRLTTLVHNASAKFCKEVYLNTTSTQQE